MNRMAVKANALNVVDTSAYWENYRDAKECALVKALQWGKNKDPPRNIFPGRGLDIS